MTKNPYLFAIRPPLAQGLLYTPLASQGQRLDEESGLYYFKNRYYDPVHGRFISRDPEGFADGPNLYAFVNNNPVCYVDPLGLEKEKTNADRYEEVLTKIATETAAEDLGRFSKYVKLPTGNWLKGKVKDKNWEAAENQQQLSFIGALAQWKGSFGMSTIWILTTIKDTPAEYLYHEVLHAYTWSMFWYWDYKESKIGFFEDYNALGWEEDSVHEDHKEAVGAGCITRFYKKEEAIVYFLMWVVPKITHYLHQLEVTINQYDEFSKKNNVEGWEKSLQCLVANIESTIETYIIDLGFGKSKTQFEDFIEKYYNFNVDINGIREEVKKKIDEKTLLDKEYGEELKRFREAMGR